MKHQITRHSQVSPYNECIKVAYYQILKQAKSMLATVEREELRYTLERQDKPGTIVGHIIHELVNPLLYLRLEEHSDGIYAIHFGIEQVNELGQLADITTRFLRILYKVTALGAFPVDIENSIRTDWFNNSCSESYEYIEERKKHHTFKLIPYKVTASKRKMLAVA